MTNRDIILRAFVTSILAFTVSACGGAQFPAAQAPMAGPFPLRQTGSGPVPSSGSGVRRLPGYTFFDLGTLGGPQSDMQGDSPILNNRNQAVGFSDTSAPSPCYPNCNPAYRPDPYLLHAFVWNGSGLTDLGALPGSNDSVAESAGPNGGATGQSENGTIDPLLGWPESHAVIWTRGNITDLGTLGGYESDAKEMNARGQVTGAAANAIHDQYSIFSWGTQTRGFIWEKGKMRDIGTLGGPDTIGLYLNGRGQITGCSYTNSSPNSSTGLPTLDPFLWQHNKMKDLGSLGGVSGCASGLNERGEVTGSSDLAGDTTQHPFVAQGGHVRDLGTLGGDYGIGNWLNDAGTVVGLSTISGSNGVIHAFRWTRGVMTDLGTLAGYCNSNANGINARGDVVGASATCDFSVSRAVAWTKGGIVDLNDFVPPSSSLELFEALYINDRGAIAGHGLMPNGDIHAFVLLPSGRSSISAVRRASFRPPPAAKRPTFREMLTTLLAREARMKHMPFLSRLIRP